jgi:hypothetical protein
MNGTSFCPNCGAPTTELTEICPKCGARVAGKVAEKAGGTWMPLTAGILDLVAGVPALLIGIVVIAGIAGFGVLGWLSWLSDVAGVAGVAGVGVIMGAIGVSLIIFALVAIVGGVFALRKRIWGLALAGSIFALFCAWIFGIPAIVFTVMGKKHFK